MNTIVVGDFNAAAKDVAAIATAKGFFVHHGHAGNQDSLVDNILLSSAISAKSACTTVLDNVHLC